MKTILAISGSLRAGSANTTLLKILGNLFPEEVGYTVYEHIGDLPHFNPDIDEEEALQPVKALREQIKNADGVVICTPEYAFGVPGVLKNALDWLVSSGELNEKPVATISASPLYRGGDRAHASLLLTLEALGVKKTAELTIPAITTKLNEQGELTHTETKEALIALAGALVKAIPR
jgi:NAD(P)H-dependent FMN reductase